MSRSIFPTQFAPIPPGRRWVVDLACPVRRRISPFNLKKGDLVGSFCNPRNAAPMFPTRRRRRQGSPVRNILLSTTNDREATRVDENGWPSAVFDNLGTRPFTLFNFQRSVKHYRRHLTMRTAGFRTAPRILFTRQRALWRLFTANDPLESPYGTTRTSPLWCSAFC